MKSREFSLNPVLSKSRTDYNKNILLEKDCSPDPFEQFEGWLTAAVSADGLYANAMTLSTVTKAGMPDSRIVLLRNMSYGGFTFFTNYHSAKGAQIDASPHACLLFFWKEMERQVRIQGEIRFLPEGESELYFTSRPFESKVGAWASRQSHVIADRESLDQRYDRTLLQYMGKDIPRPAHWGGYVLLPSAFEFWQGRKSRLHDRIRYTKQADKSWKLERLMP